MFRASLLITLCIVATPVIGEDRLLSLNGAENIEISAPLTRILVTGWQGPGISLSASDSEQIVIEQNAGHIHLKLLEEHPLVELELKIPDVNTLTINGQLADIVVKGVRADLSISNNNNPITISDINGSVQAKSYLAPVVIENVTGNVQAESNRADVKLASIDGNVWARTAGASISLKNSHSQSVELQTLNGTIKLDGEIPRHADYLLASHRGVVDVRLSPESHASIYLHGITEDFSVSGLAIQNVSDREARTRIGDGSGQLVLESPRGPIRLSVLGSE